MKNFSEYEDGVMENIKTMAMSVDEVLTYLRVVEPTTDFKGLFFHPRFFGWTISP